MVEYRPMDTAPRDGTIILGHINGEDVRIQWVHERDRLGPGWQDIEHKIAGLDEPEGWRPFDSLAEHCRHASQIVSTWPQWKRDALGRPATGPHISPNGAEPGSLVHTAEKWLLSQGLLIPDRAKHPNLFGGMIDDFSESDAGREFNA